MVVAHRLPTLAPEGSRLSCLTGWYVLGNYGSKLRESLSSEKPETQVDSGMFEFASQSHSNSSPLFLLDSKAFFFFLHMHERKLSIMS